MFAPDVKMNSKDTKTFHVAQDGQEIGVIVKNSQNAQTASASDNVNQFLAYGQATPQNSNANQLPLNGQAPQSSNVNQLPVNSLSLGTNCTAFPDNDEMVHTQSRPQPQAHGVHYETSGALTTVKDEMQTSGTGTTNTAGSYPYMNIERTPTIELYNQYQMHGINAWQHVHQDTDNKFYENNISLQTHGINAGPHAAHNATMYGRAAHQMDTMQNESLIARPFTDYATVHNACAQPQQYYQRDTLAHSVTAIPINTPSLNQPINEARPIDELRAKPGHTPQRLFQSAGNVNNLPCVESMSDDGHKPKLATIDAVVRTAPQQRKKKETRRVAPQRHTKLVKVLQLPRRHTKLVRVPQLQPKIPESGTESDAACNTDEGNGTQQEQMAGHDQNEDHMVEKGEDERENTDVCPTCKKTFDDHEIQIHLHKCKKSSSRKQGNFKCAHCKQQFNKEYVLDRHIITKHPDKNAVKKTLQHRIPCVDCNETFESDALRIHHRATVHKIKENKTFVCDTCNKRFEHRNSLTRHMDLHLPEKIHTCQYCGKKFQHISAVGCHYMYCKKAPKELQDKKTKLKPRSKAKKLFKCEVPGCNKKPYKQERYFK